MTTELLQLRQKVNAQLTSRKAAKVERKAASAEVESSEQHERDVREATAAAQGVAKSVQEQAHQRISLIVSRSLEAIFETPYEFKVVFEQKRGKTEANLVFVRDGQTVDPMTAAGGGVVAVAAFALRLSALLLQRPPVRRLMVLDEPLGQLSKEYVGRARALLETLAKECGFQFILVTHQEGLACGTIIRL